MKRKTLLIGVIAVATMLLCISGKKPSLEGTTWEYNNTELLADVGYTGDSEVITFTSDSEVKVTTIVWKIVIRKGPGTERFGTGQSSHPVKNEQTGTYTAKKIKVNKKKVTKVTITIENEMKEYIIDDNKMTETFVKEDKPQRVYEKQ